MCQEFELLLEKRRHTAEPMDSVAIDLHVRTCLACRRSYERFQRERQLQDAGVFDGLAKSRERLIVTDKRKKAFQAIGVSALTIAAALFMVQQFGSKKAERVSIPAAGAIAREVLAPVVEAKSEPLPAPPVQVAPQKVARRARPPVKVAAPRPAILAHRPEPVSVAPSIAALPEVRRPDFTLKYAAVHGAGPDVVLAPVSRPEFVAEPLSAEARGGVRPRFAVISGASMDPVLIEVAPYGAPEKPQLARAIPVAGIE